MPGCGGYSLILNGDFLTISGKGSNPSVGMNLELLVACSDKDSPHSEPIKF